MIAAARRAVEVVVIAAPLSNRSVPLRPQLLATPIAVVALALTLATKSAAAQRGVGAAYAARDPRPCPTVQATANRPPDVATATAAFICKAEHVFSGSLFLVSDVRVQVGGGTPFRELPGIHRPGGADPNATVYAIRGSYASYMCNSVGTGPYAYKAGENCRRYDYPSAEGTCFRDNFGEWSCQMLGDAQPKYGTDKQPAPRS